MARCWSACAWFVLVLVLGLVRGLLLKLEPGASSACMFVRGAVAGAFVGLELVLVSSVLAVVLRQVRAVLSRHKRHEWTS